MKNPKWIVVAAVTAATLTNGCMAFKEMSGDSHRSSSTRVASDDEALPESDRMSNDDAPSRSDAASRSEAAAAHAEAVAARASMKAQKTETGFHKSLNK